MIEINLLPLELRKSKKATFGFKEFNFLIPVILGVIIFVHILLFVLARYKNFQYNLLNKKWQANKVELERLEAWKKENQIINQDYQQIKNISHQRILVYPKLNALGSDITEGLWLRHLKIKGKVLQLDGSIVSQEARHMAIFNNFCDNLKRDNAFFKDFTSFEIGPLKTRKIANYEILDFIIEAKIK